MNPEPPKKVLIVEDEKDVMSIVKLRIEASGCEVLTAENGEEGLLKAVKEIPDLIISDVLMPGMDGFQFYKRVKKNPVTADIPILILTARGKMEDTFKVYGADEFLSKPFEMTDLLAKVEALLRRTKKAKSISKQKKSSLPAPCRKLLTRYVIC